MGNSSSNSSADSTMDLDDFDVNDIEPNDDNEIVDSDISSDDDLFEDMQDEVYGENYLIQILRQLIQR